MGLFVIATYRPKRGKARQLLRVLRTHLPTLRKQKLVTARPAYLMRAKDGTFVEVFEWKSAAAVNKAHENPAVLKMWDEFAKCCEYGRLQELKEIEEMFPHFQPVEL